MDAWMSQYVCCQRAVRGLQGNNSYTSQLMNDNTEMTRGEKRREDADMHALAVRGLREIESWEEETEDQIRGGEKMSRAQCQKDVTESGEAQDGEEYLRMAAEVKGWGGGWEGRWHCMMQAEDLHMTFM